MGLEGPWHRDGAHVPHDSFSSRHQYTALVRGENPNVVDDAERIDETAKLELISRDPTPEKAPPPTLRKG